MCGIVGYFNKSNSGKPALGGVLLGLLEALGCRGPDSAGVALFGAGRPKYLVAQVKLGDGKENSGRARAVRSIARKYGAQSFSQAQAYLRFILPETDNLEPFIAGVESLAHDVEVVSIGRKLEIIKEVGSPSDLEKTFHISGFRGRHGIGHTRLCTESAVDLSHSQPFWAHGYRDLAVVHNGHITNYHQLRRRYEQRGKRFYTDNDSEVVGTFLADRLKSGASLRAAMEAMISELDGSFSCLVATDSEFGFVKDSFSLKPLLFAETDRFVAIATEEVAIRRAIHGEFPVREGQAKEVRVWQT